MFQTRGNVRHLDSAFRRNGKETVSSTVTWSIAIAWTSEWILVLVRLIIPLRSPTNSLLLATTTTSTWLSVIVATGRAGWQLFQNLHRHERLRHFDRQRFGRRITDQQVATLWPQRNHFGCKCPVFHACKQFNLLGVCIESRESNHPLRTRICRLGKHQRGQRGKQRNRSKQWAHDRTPVETLIGNCCEI